MAEKHVARAANNPTPSVKRLLKDVGAIILTPGAGTSADHPSLLAIEERMRTDYPEVVIVRHDFPYRKAGRKLPDKAPVLVEDLEQAIRALMNDHGLRSDQIVMGGRSMGGRICSIMAASSELPIAGLFCICYPLHPPGKPEKLRVEHFPKISVPSLFVSGTNDAFGSPEEFSEHLPTIPGPHEEIWLEGKGHDLKRCDEIIATHISAWLGRR
jgi:uncharacterized protein